MRLNKKYMLLELMETIEEGINYVLKTNNSEAGIVLNDCIDAFNIIYSNVDNEEAHNLIKEINRIINSTSNNELNKTNIDGCIDIINKLRKLIVNGIKTEIEIAFMPYKTSMWDSLESVYKAANEDSDCTSYVVPIPYYELDKERKNSKFCCEMDEFLEKVNAVNYLDYCIEERQPEIIYIHNPYDDSNIITRIDEKYHSKNLKDNTRMLVYVPYCLNGSVSQVEEFSVYSQLGGVKNSDKIICQSENEKLMYVKNGVNADKILDLGSPKIDKVIKESQKEINIPKEWKDKLQGKKVFLLSTGIKDLMGVKYWFANLVAMLNYFLEDTENSLIWRPHPLTEATIKSTRPEYIDAYMNIKNHILNSNNVVLDTSKDVYTAINISDALISDYSSIIFQYTITEKPVLAVCAETYFEKDRKYLCDYTEVYLLNRDFNFPEFVNMVIKGEDPNKEERVRRLKDSLTNSDGTVGKKIHENIKNTVIKSLESYIRGN